MSRHLLLLKYEQTKIQGYLKRMNQFKFFNFLFQRYQLTTMTLNMEQRHQSTQWMVMCWYACGRNSLIALISSVLSYTCKTGSKRWSRVECLWLGRSFQLLCLLKYSEIGEFFLNNPVQRVAGGLTALRCLCMGKADDAPWRLSIIHVPPQC